MHLREAAALLGVLGHRGRHRMKKLLEFSRQIHKF